MKDVLAKVLIGDCEGYHTKFSHYIELKSEHYHIQYGDYVRLTESGLKHFDGTHKGWDVNYHNYDIVLCTSLADIKQEYETLCAQSDAIKSNLSILEKYVSFFKPKGIARDGIKHRIVQL